MSCFLKNSRIIFDNQKVNTIFRTDNFGGFFFSFSPFFLIKHAQVDVHVLSLKKKKDLHDTLGF